MRCNDGLISSEIMRDYDGTLLTIRSHLEITNISVSSPQQQLMATAANSIVTRRFAMTTGGVTNETANVCVGH